MTVELGFYLDENTTLKEQDRIIRSLNIDDAYEVGGDCGAIEFFLGGEVLMHEIENEHMPQILQIIATAGYWPSFITILGAYAEAPDAESCRAKLKELSGDYEALWKWIYEDTMGRREV